MPDSKPNRKPAEAIIIDFETGAPRAPKPSFTASVRYPQGKNLTQKPVATRDAKMTFALYSDTVVAALNTELNALGFNKRFLVDKSTINTMFAKAAVQKLTEHMLQYGSIHNAGSVPGFALYPDTIRLATRVAVSMAKRHHNGKMVNVSLEAETQFGKTIILVMAIIIYTMFEGDDSGEAVILVNPSRVAPHKQTIEDFGNALELHAAMYVDKAGQDEYDIMTVNSVMMNGALSTNDNQVARRASLKKLKLAIDEVVHAGYKRVTLVVDEADEATGELSILSSILKFCDKRSDIEVRVLLCSATAYQFKCINEFVRVEVKAADLSPDSTYCGTFVAGPQGQRSSFVSQSMIDNAFKLGGRLSNFEIGKVKRMPDSDLDVIFDTITAFARGGVLNPKLGLNGLPMNGGRGMMMRFGYSADSNRLVKRYRDKLAAKGIVPIEYHSNHAAKMNATTAANFIHRTLLQFVRAKHFDDNEGADSFSLDTPETEAELTEISKLQYVIFVHGAGRRADRFSNEVTVFIDLTANFSSATAAEQGTAGRMSGHGKMQTIGMFSENGFAMLEAMRDHYDAFGYKAPFKSAGPNTIKIEGEDGIPLVITRKIASRILFDRRAAWTQTPEIQSIFADIEAAYRPLLRWYTGVSRRTIPIHIFNSPKYKAMNPGWDRIPLNEGETVQTFRGVPTKAGFVRVQGPGIKIASREDGVSPSKWMHQHTYQWQGRNRTDRFFDIFGMLEADGRLDILQDAARAHFGDHTINFLKPMMRESIAPVRDEKDEKGVVVADERLAELKAIRLAYGRNGPVVTQDGDFYQSHEGGIVMTLNNLDRKNDGSRTYEDPSQRDRDRSYRHLLKPPLFFVREDDDGTNDVLIRFSLNTAQPFSARAGTFIAAKGKTIMEQQAVTLPRPQTTYWRYMSTDQQTTVQNQIDGLSDITTASGWSGEV